MNNIKKGRAISGFSFKFKQKQQAKKIESKRDPNTPDFFIKMTDSQRHLFANKMSEMPEMGEILTRYRKLPTICYSHRRHAFYNLKIQRALPMFRESRI